MTPSAFAGGGKKYGHDKYVKEKDKIATRKMEKATG